MEAAPQEPPPPGGMGAGPAAAPGYYAPPNATAARPLVIMWFRVYAILGALFGLLVFLLQFFVPGVPGDGARPIEWTYVAVAAPVFALYGLGAFVPYKPWAWTYGLILISLGVAGCFMPFSIILLVFWNRPQVKAAFGRL